VPRKSRAVLSRYVKDLEERIAAERALAHGADESSPRAYHGEYNNESDAGQDVLGDLSLIDLDSSQIRSMREELMKVTHGAHGGHGFQSPTLFVSESTLRQLHDELYLAHNKLLRANRDSRPEEERKVRILEARIESVTEKQSERQPWFLDKKHLSKSVQNNNDCDIEVQHEEVRTERIYTKKVVDAADEIGFVIGGGEQVVEATQETKGDIAGLVYAIADGHHKDPLSDSEGCDREILSPVSKALLNQDNVQVDFDYDALLSLMQVCQSHLTNKNKKLSFVPCRPKRMHNQQPRKLAPRWQRQLSLRACHRPGNHLP